MTIRVGLTHRTSYTYDRPVVVHPHVVRLRPAPHCRTPIVSYSLRVTPEEHFLNWQQDPFGNFLGRLVFPSPTEVLEFAVDLVADLAVVNPFDFFLEDAAQTWPFTYDDDRRRSLAPYLEIGEPGPHVAAWIADVDRSPVGTVDLLMDLNQRLAGDIGYRIRMEPGVQDPEQTLGLADGSCRDSAWLGVHLFRHLGLAARFVSGYLVQLRSDEKSLDGPSGPEEDFTDLHAWYEVYVPGAGWIGLDATSGLAAGEGHIPLAATPEPSDAAPISGATSKAEVEFDFSNVVTRLREDPRVTFPYTDDQWATIDAVGRQVDHDLDAGDVRLTMGGEPTFVGIDDPEAPDWKTAADGPAKRDRAVVLTDKLWDRFAAGGVVHHAQGKWYPGEPLPRWAMTLCWRTDGEPLWSDRSRLAWPHPDGTHTTTDAATYIAALAAALRLPGDAVVEGWEDAVHALWESQNIPVDVDIDAGVAAAVAERRRRVAAADAAAADAPAGSHAPAADTESLDADLVALRGWRAIEERALASLEEPAGFALPVTVDGDAWRTSGWAFRRPQMFLLPGDSPMGYRLPLERLAWAPLDSRRDEPVDDPSAPKPPLPNPEAAVEGAGSTRDGSDPEDLVRTAICVEARDGHVRVFLPPMPSLDNWVRLVAATEHASEATGIPIVLEGYLPPADSRLQRLSVTPDPGVLEVNVHPSASWDELVSTTTDLYALARESRLSTETFDDDGTHTGTGGGNHVTLGGPTPLDSPLLRRPALLRSLVTYWQHHPGLSYLFAGRFIGPTSQAPRVDEARTEVLYELETAFSILDATADEDEVPPWVVDRCLRHLLVDLTGNTHRSEFCIDKLYSPDSATGRLGLLELRAFEMPPHARMSLLQGLIVRALVARFWETPYRKPLVRWGTRLHDRFLLPYFATADVESVLGELRDTGYAFENDWLAPFTEFRFPRYGTAMVDQMQIELRGALEPWPVLGEEVTSTGTARFVDSSVERLQVRVDGWNADRFVVTCNGRRIPLTATDAAGDTGVAGVRYRAWKPPSSLHPTLPADGPLRFDVVDTWNGRSIGGCTYYVVHPGGRGYAAAPVNALEAESRRASRFGTTSHEPEQLPVPQPRRVLVRFTADAASLAPLAPPVEKPDPEYPATLDLRRPPTV